MKRSAVAGKMLLAGLMSLLAHGAAVAQEAKPAVASVPAAVPAPVPAAVPVPAPAARPADVASIDAIVAAVYEVVSGPAGGRDWDRMRSLFAPDAKMAAIGARQAGGFGMRSMTVEDYIARNSKFFSEQGFFESELARTTEHFGQLAHVFSTYQAKRAPSDAKPFMRGVNSIQLYHDGSRWYVTSLVWRAEDDKLSLPERYLRKR